MSLTDCGVIFNILCDLYKDTSFIHVLQSISTDHIFKLASHNYVACNRVNHYTYIYTNFGYIYPSYVGLCTERVIVPNIRNDKVFACHQMRFISRLGQLRRMRCAAKYLFCYVLYTYNALVTYYGICIEGKSSKCRPTCPL